MTAKTPLNLGFLAALIVGAVGWPWYLVVAIGVLSCFAWLTIQSWLIPDMKPGKFVTLPVLFIAFDFLFYGVGFGLNAAAKAVL